MYTVVLYFHPEHHLNIHHLKHHRNVYLTQIAKAAGMGFFREELLEHFQLKMAPTITMLQGGGTENPTMADSNSASTRQPVHSLNAFGEELLECCQGLDLYKVI